MSKTLYELQAGDEVLVANNYSEAVMKVERVTNNYVVIRHSKYRKSDGRLVGDHKWTCEHIRIATPEDIQRIREKHWYNRLVKLVSAIPFQSLTNDQLQSILSIAKQPQEQ